MRLDQLTDYGIVFAPGAELIDDQNRGQVLVAADAAGPMVTAQNNGVPQWMTNYVDPRVIDILVAPMRSEEIYPAVQKGDFATDTATFLTVESTGETAAYGDYSNNGVSGHNANFPQRQAYGFQTITQWGDRQMEVSAKARVDYASRQQIASALILRKKENAINLFGVAGLQNFGLTNDPSLSAPVAPGTGTGGNTWPLKTSDEIYADIETLFGALVTQGNGLVDADSKICLALSPLSDAQLTKQNTYGQVLKDRIKLAWPNIRFVKVPEFATPGGNLVQMIAEDVEGQPTAELAFAERLRAHGVVRKLSSFEEKKSGRSFGAVIYRPIFITQMLGV